MNALTMTLKLINRYMNVGCKMTISKNHMESVGIIAKNVLKRMYGMTNTWKLKFRQVFYKIDVLYWLHGIPLS